MLKSVQIPAFWKKSDFFQYNNRPTEVVIDNLEEDHPLKLNRIMCALLGNENIVNIAFLFS